MSLEKRGRSVFEKVVVILARLDLDNLIDLGRGASYEEFGTSLWVRDHLGNRRHYLKVTLLVFSRGGDHDDVVDGLAVGRIEIDPVRADPHNTHDLRPG